MHWDVAWLILLAVLIIASIYERRSRKPDEHDPADGWRDQSLRELWQEANGR